MDAKGTNRSMDIKIENFDLAFGDKYVGEWVLQTFLIIFCFPGFFYKTPIFYFHSVVVTA